MYRISDFFKIYLKKIYLYKISAFRMNLNNLQSTLIFLATALLSTDILIKVNCQMNGTQSNFNSSSINTNTSTQATYSFGSKSPIILQTINPATNLNNADSITSYSNDYYTTIFWVFCAVIILLYLISFFFMCIGCILLYKKSASRNQQRNVKEQKNFYNN